MPRTQIDILLNLVPDNPAAVLTHLSSNPSLASSQDTTGYSLLHAAASYGHLDLLRTLVQDYNVDPNLEDGDGETALFVVETVEAATALLELGTDPARTNGDGVTAADKFEEEAEFLDVAAFLRGRGDGVALNGEGGNADVESLVHPPPLPAGNIKINIGSVPESELAAEDSPDPEFRRRIEELAAREDFQTEAGQRELRELITDAVVGLRDQDGAAEDGGDRRRRRVGD